MLVAMLLLVLAACGSSDDESSSGENEGDETNDVGELEERDPITLSMAVNWPEDMFNERIKDHIEE